MPIKTPRWGWISLALCTTSLPMAAFAQTASSNDRTVDEVIVTGTRSLERSAVDASAPVDVVSNDSLEAVPSADLNDKLTQNVPAFNVQRMAGIAGASFVRPATLRSLSADHTLVLVNGKRRHRSAYVDLTPQKAAQASDLSQIPTIALKRVEVLRDGAAAQYGSDAIAGVINLLLEDRPGYSIITELRENYLGDGLTRLLTGRAGFALPNEGSVVVSAEYSDSDYSSRNGTPARVGLPKAEYYRLFYNATAPISENIDLYSFGNYGFSDAKNDAAYRSPSLYTRSFFQNNPPFLFPTFDFRSIYPTGFVPSFQSETTDYSIVVGARGSLTDSLSWDLSARYGRNEIEYDLENTLNFSMGPLTPTTFDPGGQAQTETGVNLDFNYQFDAGLDTPVNVAFGAEYRTEKFELTAGEPASYIVGIFSDLQPGSNSYPGVTPNQAGSWQRESWAAYVDVEADINERLNLGAAGRYEHYSDFGDTLNYKISGRYKITDNFNVRGTFSTGFHAPTPGQSHITATQQTPDAGAGVVPFPIVTLALLPPENPIAQAFGAGPLDSEKSKNFSVGFVLRPTPRFTLTADIYRIDIRDRIGVLPFIRLTPAQRATLPGASKISQIRFFINGFETRSEGLDIVATYRQPVGPGDLNLTLAYNHNTTQIREADPRFIALETVQFQKHHLPNDTAILTATYDLGKVEFLTRARYYGEWIDPVLNTPLATQNQLVPEELFFDVSATYRFNEHVAATIGAENVFDSYPGEKSGVLRAGGSIYPIFSAYDKDGGRYFVRLTANF